MTTEQRRWYTTDVESSLTPAHEVGICQCGHSEYEHDALGGCQSVEIDEHDFAHTISCNCRKYVEVEREVVHA